MVLVLSALEMEVRPLRRKLRQMSVQMGAGRALDREVRIALTGVGSEASKAAAERLLDRYPVRVAISTGFAGALSAGLEAGQLFASDAIHAPDCPALHPDRVLLDRARAVGGAALRVGASVTVPSSAGASSSREELQARHGVETVDMESYWIAGAAIRRGIPCLVVRAISDTRDQQLPDLSMKVGGTLGPPFALLAAFLRRPGTLGLIPALWRQSRLAAARLSDFLVRFLPALGQEGLAP